ncbi:LysR family transcriptional regulator [Nonomuraea basaltis]|uniref:LysR family transcriptional regulator n=1 Tax=Nonomuraea basaltis TaxID=2495887 RepID=UPI003B8481E7
MELRQLEYLVAVAEEAGFTRAAARLHVAQPGVSAQVRQLGESLFDRTGRTVRLTAEPSTRARMGLAWRSDAPKSPAARAFLDHARRHLPDLPSPPRCATPSTRRSGPT